MTIAVKEPIDAICAVALHHPECRWRNIFTVRSVREEREKVITTRGRYTRMYGTIETIYIAVRNLSLIQCFNLRLPQSYQERVCCKLK
jgi:hypothetical protein